MGEFPSRRASPGSARSCWRRCGAPPSPSRPRTSTPASAVRWAWPPCTGPSRGWLIRAGSTCSGVNQARRCSASAIPCTITIWYAAAAGGPSRSTPAESSCGRRGSRSAMDSPSPTTRRMFSGCARPARAVPETATPAPELARASGRASGRLGLGVVAAAGRGPGGGARLAAALLERLAETLELQVTVVLGRDVELLGRAVGMTDGQLVRLARGNLAPVDVRDVHGDRLGAQADSFHAHQRICYPHPADLSRR